MTTTVFVARYSVKNFFLAHFDLLQVVAILMQLGDDFERRAQLVATNYLLDASLKDFATLIVPDPRLELRAALQRCCLLADDARGNQP